MLSIRSLFNRGKKPQRQQEVCYIHLEETDSTNRYCREELREQLAGNAQPRLTVVTTEYQSAGKGQGSNTWESERGRNLLFSVVCHPVWIPVTAQFLLSECIAMAIRDVLSKLTDGITIKWPNDIYYRDRKVCGILIENSLQGGHIKDCIIGVGLDVNQTVFRGDAPNPMSLAQILGHEVDRERLLQDIVSRFDRYLRGSESGLYGDIATLYQSYLYRQSGFYRYRDSYGEFEAALVEVEDDGHLVLRDRAGRIRSYAFKEVEYII